jgi:RimJ/RimL family protein N-acetyltransferase
MMELRVLSQQDCEIVRQWRNDSLVALRTSFPLTREQQESFYRETVCNRNAKARYWGIWDIPEIAAIDSNAICNIRNYFIGMCGIENIEWENRLGEISIIIDPEKQHKGYGEQALKLLLEQGFNYLNLANIYGECYACNPAMKFWVKMCGQYDAHKATLPKRKFWDGVYWDSMYFNFNREAFLKCHQ